jgi:uncharacterized protein YkwD
VKSARAAAAIAAVLFLCVTSAAAACTRTEVSGANARIEPSQGINAALVDAAILSEMNYQRCRHGVSPLTKNTGLRAIAAKYSGWMAKTMTVSHRSSAPGQSTLRARMSTSGVSFSVGAENLAMVHRFRVEGVNVRKTGSCSYVRSNGKPVGAHSYATLARYVVDLWMASPSHRRNVLARDVRVVGSAMAFNGNAPYCGQFYIAQNYAG